MIEVDGSSHIGREDYDQARDQAFSLRGLRVLRLTNTQVETDLNNALEAIQATIAVTPPSLVGKGVGGLGPDPAASHPNLASPRKDCITPS